MNFNTALDRNYTIIKALGDGWVMSCQRLPDDNNVNVSWTKKNVFISCSLYDDTLFHVSVGLGIGITFWGMDKDPRKALQQASRKALSGLHSYQDKYNELINIFTES